MSGFPVLTFLILGPLVGAVLLAGWTPSQPRACKALALAFSLGALGLTLVLWSAFDPSAPELQFVEKKQWAPSLGIEYFLGLDGLSLILLLLTALVTAMAIFASPSTLSHPQLYFSLLLFLESGLFGTFTAFNFFHWFLFWELSLIPAFFLIRLWGGRERNRAATQFFIYTMVGSIGLFLGFLAIFLATGSFNFLRLAELGRTGELASALNVRLGWYHLSREQLPLVIFALVFFGFAVKVPIVPFHTWLPLTYAEAPTPVTMMLTGVMSKMGVYGLLRLAQPLFPEQMRLAMPILLFLALASIILAAVAACGQTDLKRLLGYSSINHLGYCLLGACAVARLPGHDPRLLQEKAAALNGVIFQIFNHGLIAATLFAFVGFLEQRSPALTQLGDVRGLRGGLPRLASLLMLTIFASLGLPGLSGFVGEFLIFKGSFPLAPAATTLALSGLLLSAIFLLRLLDQLLHGTPAAQTTRWPDLRWQETFLVLPAVVLIVCLGIFPQIFTGLVGDTIQRMVSGLGY